MAGSLRIDDVADDLIARLERRAAWNGRSIEAEHRFMLLQGLADEEEPSFDEAAAELRRQTECGRQTPSETLLREGMDGR